MKPDQIDLFADPSHRIPPRPGRWRTFAICSWIVPILSVIGGAFLVITQWDLQRYWVSWALLGLMLLQGFMLSVVPLSAKSPWREGGKTHALVGLIFSMLAVGWCGMCLLTAGTIMYVRSPEVRQAAADARREQEQQRQAAHEAEFQRQREQELEERRHAEEAAYQEFLAKRKEQIQLRDKEIAHRFQFGGSSPHPPRVPTGFGRRRTNDLDPTKVPTIQSQPLKLELHDVVVRDFNGDFLRDRWWFEADSKIQDVALEHDESAAHKVANWQRSNTWGRRQPRVLWAGDESDSRIYVLDGKRLLEVDTATWKLLREVQLGYPAAGIARCGR